MYIIGDSQEKESNKENLQNRNLINGGVWLWDYCYYIIIIFKHLFLPLKENPDLLNYLGPCREQK